MPLGLCRYTNQNAIREGPWESFNLAQAKGYPPETPVAFLLDRSSDEAADDSSLRKQH
jgi:hypothetical protein